MKAQSQKLQCPQAAQGRHRGDGTVTLQLPNNNKQKTLTVLDLNGKQVYKTTVTQDKLTLNLSTLPRGMYFVIVQTDDGVWQQKVVVQ